MLRLATLLALILVSSVSVAKELTIALDLSGSNPLIGDPRFASVVADHVRDMVLAMQPGDTVHLRTFGAQSLDNFGTKSVRLDQHNTRAKVADGIGALIRSIPGADIKGQSSTNLIGFFAFTDFGCEDGGIVAAYTDGIESSEYITSEALLSGTPLPGAEPDALTGCRVVMFGLGSGVKGSLPAPKLKTLRDAWRAWMETAGATFETIINP